MNITTEMRWHLGDSDSALLEFSESRHSFSIDKVLVPSRFRGQGIGSQLINRVLILADAQDKEVYLSARPIGQTDEVRLQALVDYYRRFDFVPTDRGLTVVYMKRARRSEVATATS